MEVIEPKLHALPTRTGKNGLDVGTVDIQTLNIIVYENAIMRKPEPFAS